ncbi:hypothetical protein [Brevundimonas terrae]|uniref:hypothetical protein n=1 Tax=Brevundimonas terrae TaxID=363631 RepID=UPI00141F1DC3|nr:hypothetical protein [Brevundimonas terrae]NIJ26968.1 hypothetical protein [Brevundimonas terrae]
MPKPITLSRYAPVALASAFVLVSACDTQPTPQAPAKEPRTETVVVTLPVLDRAELLAAIDRAASAYASGQVAERENLSGRRFLIRQPMGCQAPLAAGSAAPQGVGVLMKIENAPDLKLTLSPADWTKSLERPEGAGGWEAAEGFWLAWPWLRTDVCPQPPLSADEPVVEGDAVEPSLETSAPSMSHTAGLASVFEVDGSRLKRRMGRAYEYTLRGDGKTPPVKDQGGYRLVMEGRIAAFSDGRSIRCHAANADQRPACVAAVHLERVAFETSGGQQLSEWRGG